MWVGGCFRGAAPTELRFLWIWWGKELSHIWVMDWDVGCPAVGWSLLNLAAAGEHRNGGFSWRVWVGWGPWLSPLWCCKQETCAYRQLSATPKRKAALSKRENDGVGPGGAQQQCSLCGADVPPALGSPTVQPGSGILKLRARGGGEPCSQGVARANREVGRRRRVWVLGTQGWCLALHPWGFWQQ